jgi:hypothetical protein
MSDFTALFSLAVRLFIFITENKMEAEVNKFSNFIIAVCN